MKVKDLEQGQDVFTFVSDELDVQAIRGTLGRYAVPYDSFFVKMDGGDYETVYGMSGKIPLLDNLVFKIL